jgi:hypothetical protein
MICFTISVCVVNDGVERLVCKLPEDDGWGAPMTEIEGVSRSYEQSIE